jgi:hypothetical protein
MIALCIASGGQAHARGTLTGLLFLGKDGDCQLPPARISTRVIVSYFIEDKTLLDLIRAEDPNPRVREAAAKAAAAEHQKDLSFSGSARAVTLMATDLPCASVRLPRNEARSGRSAGTGHRDELCGQLIGYAGGKNWGMPGPSL